MDRRRFLAGAGTAGVLSLAGCAALGDTTDANALFVSEGSDRYFSFSADGTEVASAGLRFRAGTAADGPVPFEAWIDQERDLAISDLRVEFALPDRNGGLYMEPPAGNPWPDISYTHAEDHPGTLLAVADLGAQAESTTALDFRYDPWVDDPVLGFDVSFALESPGVLPTRYRCDARRDIPVPAET